MIIAPLSPQSGQFRNLFGAAKVASLSEGSKPRGSRCPDAEQAGRSTREPSSGRGCGALLGVARCHGDGGGEEGQGGVEGPPPKSTDNALSSVC